MYLNITLGKRIERNSKDVDICVTEPFTLSKKNSQNKFIDKCVVCVIHLIDFVLFAV